ncbi:hypothetical protein R1flu_000894 [Riccia fluitans]|uniref:Uncharacterized protein n=1 Tax=Riccia fluitans TaxID=41844 RepID=A0ABD1Y5T7_9MARC
MSRDREEEISRRGYEERRRRGYDEVDPWFEQEPNPSPPRHSNHANIDCPPNPCYNHTDTDITSKFHPRPNRSSPDYYHGRHETDIIIIIVDPSHRLLVNLETPALTVAEDRRVQLQDLDPRHLLNVVPDLEALALNVAEDQGLDRRVVIMILALSNRVFQESTCSAGMDAICVRRVMTVLGFWRKRKAVKEVAGVRPESVALISRVENDMAVEGITGSRSHRRPGLLVRSMAFAHARSDSTFPAME